MLPPEETLRLRIYLNATSTYRGRPLYEAVVGAARSLRLAGATVVRGIAGFGPAPRAADGRHDDVPVIVEVVDDEGNINTLLDHLEALPLDGLITIERVHLLRRRNTL